jgi:hypothetical protein
MPQAYMSAYFLLLIAARCPTVKTDNPEVSFEISPVSSRRSSRLSPLSEGLDEKAVAKERYTRKWLTTRIDRSIVIYFMI